MYDFLVIYGNNIEDIQINNPLFSSWSFQSSIYSIFLAVLNIV